MKKNWLALLLIAALLVSALPSLAAPEQYEVTYLSCWQGSAAGFPTNQADNPIANIIKERFGITLVMADTGGGVSEVQYLNTMFAADTVPDVVNAPYWGIGAGGEGYVLLNAAREGMIKDIAPYLKDYPNLYENYDKYISETAKRNILYDKEYPQGALYFIPNYVNAEQEEYQTAYGDALYAREDVLKAVGVDRMDVTDLDKLHELLVKIRDAGIKDFSGNPIIPISAAHLGWRHANIYNYMLGNTISSWRQGEDGKVSHYLFTDFPEKRVAIMRKLVQDNLIDVECFSQSAEMSDQKVAQGKYAVMAVDAGYASKQYMDLYAQDHPECKWVRLNLKNQDGNPTVDVYGYGWTGGGLTFFRKDIPEDKLRAILEMFDFLSTPEGYLLNQYGILDETYTMDAGYPQVKEDFQAKVDENPKVRSDFGINMFNGFVLLNMENTLWPKPREAKSPTTQLYEELMDEMRPRVIVDKISINELARSYEGWADFQDMTSTVSIGEELGRAYFMESDEEVQAVIDGIRKVYTDAGVDKVAAYIEEQLKQMGPEADNYAF